MISLTNCSEYARVPLEKENSALSWNQMHQDLTSINPANPIFFYHFLTRPLETRWFTAVALKNLTIFTLLDWTSQLLTVTSTMSMKGTIGNDDPRSFFLQHSSNTRCVAEHSRRPVCAQTTKILLPMQIMVGKVSIHKTRQQKIYFLNVFSWFRTPLMCWIQKSY